MRYFLLNDTRSGLHHGCEVVMRNLIDAIYQQDAEAEILTLCTGQILSEEKWLTQLQTIDIVIINGEGTLHSASTYGAFLIKLGNIAKLQKKFVALINSTWQNNPDYWIDLIQNFDLIALRDQKSFETLKGYHLTQLYYAPDLTFISKHQNIKKRSSTSDAIIVNDSVYADIADQLFHLSQVRKFDYYPITRKLPTEKDIEGYNPKKLKKLKLYSILSRISFGLFTPRRFYQDLSYAIDNTTDFKNTLTQSKLVITGRYHCLCFCLQMQIPVLIIASNTNKMNNLLEDMGISDRHITIEELKRLNNDELYQRAQYSNEEFKQIEQFKQHAQSLHFNIFNAIAKHRLSIQA